MAINNFGGKQINRIEERKVEREREKIERKH